ncbi:MAG: UvrB/UvrC motif-containing protein [Candidatus Eisenbacteria bacterium]|uniref:UvrB/UvrC motif-containing protein n=1 Tax=Eiseniibacteriota bacterium TaxID=2212470 RepID=A0A956LXY8_UNCEI|nr:UvrB/UvrC motif-containing protein [Candidatus Eisenbacteria bacterium]
MKCQNCGESESTIHFKEVVEGNLREIHLCEACARDKGFHIAIEHNKLSIAGQFIWMAENLYPESAAKVGSVQCATCGLRYSQFTRIGRLGCPDCYGAFQPQLMQILRRVHGETTHRGRLPRETTALAEPETPAAVTPPPRPEDVRKQRLRQLRRELEAAVASEAFEEAARLRDSIRALESEPPGEPG